MNIILSTVDNWPDATVQIAIIAAAAFYFYMLLK
jgi:hypothetical protein